MGDVVDLRASKSSQEPFVVLTPSQGDWGPTDLPKLRWLDNNSLEVTVPNRTEFGLRVSTYLGVDIQVRYENDDPVDRANWLGWQKRHTEWVSAGGTGPEPQPPPFP
jgi:hypothetical protein